MKKYFRFHILLIILVIGSLVFSSCTRRYYSEYQGKVTKGYKKPPKRWTKQVEKVPKAKKKLKD